MWELAINATIQHVAAFHLQFLLSVRWWIVRPETRSYWEWEKNICCVLAENLLYFHWIYKLIGMCSVKSEWKRLIL